MSMKHSSDTIENRGDGKMVMKLNLNSVES
jgi:hypothetical protein